MIEPTDPAPSETPSAADARSAGDTAATNAAAGDATSAAPVSVPAAPRRSFGRRHWGKLTLLAFIGAPAVVFAVWVAVGSAFVYSTGERAGFVQKISKKGWVCKTWEGEMAISTIPGSMPQLWAFSVRDDSIANAIESTNGKRVVLEYEEKPWLPTTCFGETKYFVRGVRVVGDAPQPM
jgi:hypothetical protein